MTDKSQELQVKAMKAEGSAQELSGKASRMVPVNVRLPAHVYEQLANEAERRSEDMAVTVRRHITSGMTRDQMDARLDEIDRKLESLLDGDPTAQLEAYKKRARYEDQTRYRGRRPSEREGVPREAHRALQRDRRPLGRKEG